MQQNLQSVMKTMNTTKGYLNYLSLWIMAYKTDENSTFLRTLIVPCVHFLIVLVII